MPTTVTRLMPAGCDQQGRHATRPEFAETSPDTVPGWPPYRDTVPTQAAEACTEVGAEPDRLPRPVRFRLLLWLVACSWLAVAGAWHLVALLLP